MRREQLRLMVCFSSIVLLFLGSPVAAQSSEPTADEIAKQMLRTDAFGWEGAKTRLRMVLTDRAGVKREQVMEILGRRRNGLLQTVVRFLSPQNVAGTAFLMRENKGGASEQYIYLSGLKRTRRIVGREREGSFMGSDFTYADMQRLDAKQAKNKRLADEDIGGTSAYVIESTISADAPSTYSKIVTWIRKKDHVALRTRFYDKQGRLSKTLYTRRIREIDGNPVVMEARMQNEQNGHVTDLFIDSIERRDDMPDSAFTPTALEHM